MESNTKNAPALVERQSMQSLLGSPALIPGEKLVEYEDLLRQVTTSVKPNDIIEEIWVRDVVDLTWEILRMRRLKGGFLTSVQPQGVEHVLGQVLREGPIAAPTLAKEWAARDPDAIKKVEDLLSAKGLTMDLTVARALAININVFERIDAVAMNLEARRNAALRELQRHRASLGSAVCRATDEVLDAEFREVTSSSGQRDTA
jgi:hypothetical protein